jgi:hypothetical protein
MSQGRIGFRRGTCFTRGGFTRGGRLDLGLLQGQPCRFRVRADSFELMLQSCVGLMSCA